MKRTSGPVRTPAEAVVLPLAFAPGEACQFDWSHETARLGGEVIAEHERCFARDRTLYNPWHHLPVLARKPGARRDGEPFRDWALSPALAEVR